MAFTQIHFVGAADYGEGRLSHRGGVACQQKYFCPGVQLVVRGTPM